MRDIYGGEEPFDVYKVERALGAFERDMSHAGRARMEESPEKMAELVMRLASDAAFLEDTKGEESSTSFSSESPMATTAGVEQVAPTSTTTTTVSASSATATTSLATVSTASITLAILTATIPTAPLSTTLGAHTIVSVA